MLDVETHGALAVGTAPVPTTTRLHLSAPRVRFGHEGTDRLSVTVTPRVAGAVSGTALIRTASRTLCTAHLRRGSGSCRLAARELSRGLHRLRAHFDGNASHAGSTSATVRLLVTR